jgi:lipopolysaccharide transport system ATP-binding protein
MTPAIKANGLSKKYLIRHRQNSRSESLRDEISGFMGRLGRRAPRAHYEEFWALKDISFEINQGDRVGVIGRNGAGKSTLLKILSRITEPTSGRVTIRGRVASLLEVGTGFHPELTGRENIFLNGAILGMKRHEVHRKLDEIVAFAEVEKFLDTPVKRYSSGMYVRLAFAVAAHLEPEILIVDEVLAVGDAAFQRKCLARMSSVGNEGTTVLFVSHNLAAVRNLCGTAILLAEGGIAAHGEVDGVLHDYLTLSQRIDRIPLWERIDRRGSGIIRFVSCSMQDGNGHTVSAFHSGQNVKLFFAFTRDTSCDLRNVVFAVGVDTEMGERIAYFSNDIAGQVFEIAPESVTGFTVDINKLPLTPGLYRLTLYCAVNGDVADWMQSAATMVVEAGDYYGTGRLPPSASQGHLFIDYSFKLCGTVADIRPLPGLRDEHD